MKTAPSICKWAPRTWGRGRTRSWRKSRAETLGVTLDKMIVCSGDTDFTPFDVGAYASSTTIISGGAVKKASEKVRDAPAAPRLQDARYPG